MDGYAGTQTQFKKKWNEAGNQELFFKKEFNIAIKNFARYWEHWKMFEMAV